MYFRILEQLQMNLYDKKVIKCSNCKKTVGEIDMDVQIVDVLCKKCKKKIAQNETSYNYLDKRMIETIMP
ncbi:hypothetical protein [Nitrosopumilus piranensis]|uniref:Uncharacterized protein n=1 Tax=Nitrosopumilus piranensis TaxID=1582439 RepID=A0A0C5CAT2_9ARCH|nr:hypothetical protein [Nitrosopumilus piranensis]AJM92292.1 hypothetical protein NPIRD3C_1080 [Nitrosopumilus piranensis]